VESETVAIEACHQFLLPFPQLL